MTLDHPSALHVAQRYFDTPLALTRLGWGIGGFVYLSPDNLSAVKIHRGDEGFRTELEVYRRLRRLRITQLHGLTIPRLLDFYEADRLIRMDFVAPPFLLDFAGVLFHPPDFSDDAMQHWRAGIEVRYGPNAWIAHLVHDSLAKRGIYYMDFRPTNMKLDGYPGLEPLDPSAADEL